MIRSLLFDVPCMTHRQIKSTCAFYSKTTEASYTARQPRLRIERATRRESGRPSDCTSNCLVSLPRYCTALWSRSCRLVSAQRAFDEFARETGSIEYRVSSYLCCEVPRLAVPLFVISHRSCLHFCAQPSFSRSPKSFFVLPLIWL